MSSTNAFFVGNSCFSSNLNKIITSYFGNDFPSTFTGMLVGVDGTMHGTEFKQILKGKLLRGCKSGELYGLFRPPVEKSD